MNFRPLIIIAAALLLASTAPAAQVKISDLPIITAPSTNTFLEVADMDEVTKSRKYLLTNLLSATTPTSSFYVTNLYVTNLFANVSHISNLFVTNITANTTVTTNLTIEQNFTIKGNGTVIISNITYSLVPVWTNNAGVIEPLGAQLTNVFRFTSGLADNSTNLAFSLSSANEWHPGALMQLVKSGDKTLLQHFAGGSLYLTANTNQNQALLSMTASSIVRDIIQASGAGGMVFELFAKGGLYLNSHETSGNAMLFIDGCNLLGNSPLLEIYDRACSEEFKIDHTGKVLISQGLTTFEPDAANGTTAYTFNTEATHTSGIIARVQNANADKLTVDFAGTLGVISAIVTNNIGAKLTVGDTTFVDVSRASQTNSVTGALTFAHATNGVHGLDQTHVRWLFVPSGGPHTLTIPALWRTNVYSAVPPALTNGTIYRMIVACGGATASAAAQTNCYVSWEYYK